MSPQKLRKRTPNRGWRLAVKRAGTQDLLAEALRITQGMVSQYLHGEKRCRPSLAIELEERFGVPRWLTRPDVWRKPKEEHVNHP